LLLGDGDNRLDIERPDPATAHSSRREQSIEREAARRRIVNLLRDERHYWARQTPPP
jgi:hypothetical protein